MRQPSRAPDRVDFDAAPSTRLGAEDLNVGSVDPDASDPPDLCSTDALNAVAARAECPTLRGPQDTSRSRASIAVGHNRLQRGASVRGVHDMRRQRRLIALQRRTADLLRLGISTCIGEYASKWGCGAQRSECVVVANQICERVWPLNRLQMSAGSDEQRRDALK